MAPSVIHGNGCRRFHSGSGSASFSSKATRFGSRSVISAASVLLVTLLMASSLPIRVLAANKLLPCTYSNIKGYTSSVRPFKGLRLNWKVVGSIVKFDLRATGPASKGWFSVGFSTDGEMTGDAITVTSSTATSATIHMLTGESGSSVAESTDWTPANLAIKRKGGGASLKFERSASDGSPVPFNPKGKNILMFAYKSTAFDTNDIHDEE
ncbi:unnamed protein product [Closterium sp. Yama58-4]|nr:unnamed protein product [Closterium sp. Yama58-4]